MSLGAIDSSMLTTIASVVAASGSTMLTFRLARELQMGKEGEQIWIPYADWLLVLATSLSLLFVIVPLLVADSGSWLYQMLPVAACTAAAILLAGYPFSIFAHYRLIFRGGRVGPRTNPEPAECVIVTITLVLGTAGGFWAALARLR